MKTIKCKCKEFKVGINDQERDVERVFSEAVIALIVDAQNLLWTKREKQLSFFIIHLFF